MNKFEFSFFLLLKMVATTKKKGIFDVGWEYFFFLIFQIKEYVIRKEYERWCSTEEQEKSNKSFEEESLKSYLTWT